MNGRTDVVTGGCSVDEELGVEYRDNAASRLREGSLKSELDQYAD